MKKSVSLIIFCVMLCASASVWAQTQQAKAWNLQECIEYGIQNNLQVQGAKLNVETNRISAKQAKLSQIPSLNASFGSQVGWGRNLDQTTYEYKDQRLFGSNLGLNSSIDIFSGFQLRNRIKQAGFAAQSSHYGLLKAENDVKLEIVSAYLNAIFNQELVGQAVSQLESISKQLERTKALVEAGAKPRTDLLEMESQLATREVDLVRNQNSLSSALLRLKQSMQLPSSEKLDVIVPVVSVSGLLIENVNSNDVFQRAQQTLPEVKRAEMDLKSAHSQVAQSFGSLLPTLSLSGYVNTRYSDGVNSKVVGNREVIDDTPQAIGLVNSDPSQIVYTIPTNEKRLIPVAEDGYSFGDQFNDNVNYGVSLSLRIPIFNGYSSRANYQRSKLQQKQAEIQKDQINNQLRQQIEQAYNDAQASLKVYQSAQKQVSSLEETFKATDKRYNLGAVSFVDYQVAQSNFIVAQSQLIQAKYDYIFKTKVLDFYLGKPLAF